MRATWVGGTAALVIAIGAGTALAQVPAYITASPDAANRAFGRDMAARIFSDAFTDRRQVAVARSQQDHPGFNCPSNPQIALAVVIPYPIRPNEVSWIERYVLGCTPRTMRSFLMTMDGTQPRVMELLPGQTNADPLLQRDALKGASAAASAVRAAGCNRSMVIDTRITAPPQGGGPWSERWTYDQCGARAEVDVSFTPSAGAGTTWNVKLVR